MGVRIFVLVGCGLVRCKEEGIGMFHVFMVGFL